MKHVASFLNESDIKQCVTELRAGYGIGSIIRLQDGPLPWALSIPYRFMAEQSYGGSNAMSIGVAFVRGFALGLMDAAMVADAQHAPLAKTIAPPVRDHAVNE